MRVEFKAWPKIPRYSTTNKVCITEKMDGSNGCIVIKEGVVVAVQSRSQFITPEYDNYGFAKWVYDNKEELSKLGDGYHYGEWVGPGIQKNPHNLIVKSFYLFNVKRWGKHNPNTPKCCEVVRVIYDGPLEDGRIGYELDSLESYAQFEGYTPEGIVIFDYNSKSYSKITFKNQEGKWKNC